MDARNLIFIPRWVKILTFLLLSTILCVGIYISVYFMADEKRATWLLASISLVQIALSGILVFLFVAFTQRDAAFSRVRAEVDHFLEYLLPVTFRRIDAPHPPRRQFGSLWSLTRIRLWRRRQSRTVVFIEHLAGAIGASYEIVTQQDRVRMFVELNVWRLVTVYYIPAQTKEDASRLKDSMQFTFPTEGKDGFAIYTNYSEEWFDGRWYLNFILIRELDKNFLYDNVLKLHVANLVFTHLESLLRNCRRDGTQLSYYHSQL